MKAKELAEKLLKYPDFDVDIAVTEYGQSEYGMTVIAYKVIGIGDIGHSEKLIRLDIEQT